jgi:ABC-type nickel/cobalt efflux system permease component RcnA
MSSDGSRVFFISASALTPGALDEACAYEQGGECLSQAFNVYEYEDGHVYLLSNGRDTHSSFGGSVSQFITASASGNDIFIQSGEPLLGQGGADTGQAYIYDVRVDGGFQRPASPAACQSDACQGPSRAAPLVPSPSTLTASGSGNRHAKKHHKHRHHHHRSKRAHQAHHRARPANIDRRAEK